jgi:hypothetical protein
MKPATLFRLAVAGGRSDTLRIALTAIGTALGTVTVLATATVASIRGYRSYSVQLLNEPGLRPGVVTALLLLCVPVLFFVGQCARVGAPARDRRLAAIRMAGATPRQIAAVASTETGVAGALGALLGIGAYLAARVALGGSASRPPLPTDITLPVWVFLLVVVGLPLTGAWFASLALRRVSITPFGVMRHERVNPPRVAPGLLFLIGTAGLILFSPLFDWLEHHLSLKFWAFVGPVGLFTVFTALGLVLGSAALSAALGRVIAARARRPAMLIAARRLAADPWASSRALAALLVSVFIGAGALAVRAAMLTEVNLQAESNRADEIAAGQPAQSVADPFYKNAFDVVQLAIWAAIVIAAAGLLVAALDQFLERRRTLAALVAQGTPRGVLAGASMLQVILPMLPGVALASVAGMLAGRGVYDHTSTMSVGGGCVTPLNGPNNWCDDPTHFTPLRDISHAVPVPWGELVLLGGGTVLATVAVTAVSLLLLRRSTDIGELRAAA